LGIGLQAFFFSFLFPWSYFNLISVVTCLQVNSVWLVSIFLFFKFFIYFYPSTLGCLVTELHNFIQFAFNGVTLVSQSGRRFDMLTRMGSCWLFSYRFIVVKFFSSLFIIIAFFLFKLFKLIKFIKPGHINNLSLIYIFLLFWKCLCSLDIFFNIETKLDRSPVYSQDIWDSGCFYTHTNIVNVVSILIIGYLTFWF
jgi:hypothetical protein